MRVMFQWRFASEIIHLSAHADWQCALYERRSLKVGAYLRLTKTSSPFAILA